MGSTGSYPRRESDPVSRDWRRSIAWLIFWGYFYQLVFWPLVLWLCAVVGIPGPPVVPWEALISGTLTLASIGGIQVARDRLKEKGD